jgi:uncharacterized DUF497 family protein
MSGYRFEFEWDPIKARANVRKHEIAMEPLALTIPDEVRAGRAFG